MHTKVSTRQDRSCVGSILSRINSAPLIGPWSSERQLPVRTEEEIGTIENLPAQRHEVGALTEGIRHTSSTTTVCACRKAVITDHHIEHSNHTKPLRLLRKRGIICSDMARARAAIIGLQRRVLALTCKSSAFRRPQHVRTP